MALILSGDTGVPASGMPTGSVIQTTQTTNSTEISINSASLVTTNISASITPTSSTSKILVRFMTSIYAGGSNHGCALAIYRGATRIWYPGGTNSSGGYGSFYCGPGAQDLSAMVPIEYLDSPGTTSSTTYTLYACTFSGLAVSFNISNSPQPNQTSIILMEIKQ